MQKVVNNVFYNRRSNALYIFKKEVNTRNYELLDIEYKGATFKYTVRCPKNHLWKVAISNFKKTNCNKCNIEGQRNTLEECHSLAKERGLVFKGKEYKNNKIKYPWKCKSCGYHFLAKFNVIKSGGKCAKCANRIPTNINDCIKIARKFNMEFNDKFCNNNRELHNWKCNEGHIFVRSYFNFKRTPICIICNTNSKPKGIGECKKLAEELGFLLESNQIYKNNKSILYWICNKDHLFKNSYNHLSRHKTCPRCHPEWGNSKCQKIIYDYVLSITPFAIQKVRKMLPSKALELDIYIPYINKGVEYDGWRHSSPKQIERDKRKDKECKELGIPLLRIVDKDFRSKKKRNIIFKYIDDFLLS